MLHIPPYLPVWFYDRNCTFRGLKTVLPFAIKLFLFQGRQTE
jgi:hypothetical protein